MPPESLVRSKWCDQTSLARMRSSRALSYRRDILLNRPMKKLLVISLFSLVLRAQEKVDLAVIQRIKTEAFQNSKVMDHLFWITDVYGPRLTGSPGFTAAANWTVKRLKDYGIDDAAIEPW